MAFSKIAFDIKRDLGGLISITGLKITNEYANSRN